MIFQNIDFHNVQEMTPAEGGGYDMWRVPANVRAAASAYLRETSARYSCGVELRFRLRGESADIRLRVLPDEEPQVAYLYYGSIQGGCSDSGWVIGTEDTVIHIRRPKNMDALKRVSEGAGLPFSPEVARLVLPYGVCVFMGAEGDIEPPRADELPGKTYLAYGSSITHGSMALCAPHTYAFRIAQKLGCDYLNLGFAGSACLEREMAEHIVGRADWNVASVELGINALGMTYDEFEARADAFTAILASDGRPVFATSIFGFNGSDEDMRKAADFREIVKKYAGARLRFIDGLELLNNPAFISQDMVHPSLEGAEQIANRFYEFMRASLWR